MLSYGPAISLSTLESMFQGTQPRFTLPEQPKISNIVQWGFARFPILPIIEFTVNTHLLLIGSSLILPVHTEQVLTQNLHLPINGGFARFPHPPGKNFPNTTQLRVFHEIYIPYGTFHQFKSPSCDKTLTPLFKTKLYSNHCLFNPTGLKHSTSQFSLKNIQQIVYV